MIEHVRIDHRAAGVATPIEHELRLGADPAEIRVELGGASREELVEFTRLAGQGWPARFVNRAQAALAVPSLPARDYLVRAKAAGIRLAAVKLLALHEARHGWHARMAELLLAGPRVGRDHTAKDPDPGESLPGGEIYLSMLGLRDLFVTRVAGEIADCLDQFDHPSGLQCYAGFALITLPPCKIDFVVALRLVHNHYLGAADYHRAFCSLTQ